MPNTLANHGKIALHRKIQLDIYNVGWSCMAYFPTKNGSKVPYVHTVGMTERNMPELFISGGLDFSTLYNILEVVICRWSLHGLQLGIHRDLFNCKDADKARIKLIELDTASNAVRERNRVMFDWYEGTIHTPRVVQVIWADCDGCLADEPEFKMEKFIEILDFHPCGDGI